MMMWHYVWWHTHTHTHQIKSGQYPDDVTLSMMMWHYVWWCDTMYDDTHTHTHTRSSQGSTQIHRWPYPRYTKKNYHKKKSQKSVLRWVYEANIRGHWLASIFFLSTRIAACYSNRQILSKVSTKVIIAGLFRAFNRSRLPLQNLLNV